MEVLLEEHGIYLTSDGRMSLAGLTSKDIEAVAEAIVEVVDSADQLATGMVAFVVKEYRIVTARGGSVTVVVTGRSAEFFSALQAEGYESPQVVRTGPLVVEVTFVPRTGDEASWVRCEVVGEVVCTHG